MQLAYIGVAPTLLLVLLGPILIGLPVLGLFIRTRRGLPPSRPIKAFLITHFALLDLAFIAGYMSEETLLASRVSAWVGASIPFLFTFALVLLTLLADYDPRRSGHCPCGYNLTGNRSGVCPECGQRIAPEPPDQHPSELA